MKSAFILVLASTSAFMVPTPRIGGPTGRRMSPGSPVTDGRIVKLAMVPVGGDEKPNKFIDPEDLILPIIVVVVVGAVALAYLYGTTSSLPNTLDLTIAKQTDTLDLKIAKLATASDLKALSDKVEMVGSQESFIDGALKGGGFILWGGINFAAGSFTPFFQKLFSRFARFAQEDDEKE